MALLSFSWHGDQGVSSQGAVARLMGVAVALAICCAPTVQAGTWVQFNTQLGTIDLDLFDDVVPETVANFLSYANSNAFTNTVVHRSTSIADSGLAVIQGGGYTGTQSGFVPISTNSPIALQYVLPNAQGTIAMARQNLPNTATSQWFINTVDNSDVLGASNGGGYAVFGHILGKGLSVAQAINNLPKGSFGGFGNVPFKNFTSGTPTQANLVLMNSVIVKGAHASYQNPLLLGDVNNDGNLRVGDVHAVITELLVNGVHDLDAAYSGSNYVDLNGDGRLSVVDVNRAITELLTTQSDQSDAPVATAFRSVSSEPFGRAAFAVVPEPTSLSLAATAALALLAGVWWRRRR